MHGWGFDMVRIGLGVAAGALGLSMTAPLMAQVPPELFGGGEIIQDNLDKTPFYESPDGTWVVMSPPGDKKNGLSCMVSYITAKPGPKGAEVELGDVFSIMGPVNASQMEQGIGAVMFAGPRIPQANGDKGQATITILSDEAPNTTKTGHMENGEWDLFLTPVYINQMIDADNPKESIGIEYEGREVFRVNIVEYNSARTMLRNCMAKYTGKRPK
jgi:hypothetical protein